LKSDDDTLTPDEQVLRYCGIPVYYTQKPLKLDRMRFARITASVGGKVMQITPDSQTAFLHELLSKIHLIGGRRFFAVGATTDGPAMSVAAHLAKCYGTYCLTQLGELPKIRWFNVGKPNIDRQLMVENDYKLVVAANITDSKTPDENRIKAAKDILHMYDNTTRLVVVNTSDVLAFSVKHLGIKPDAVWQFTPDQEIEVA